MDTKISKYFPLKSTECVIKLFKSQIENEEKTVDLSVISIVLGWIENSLCNNRENNKCTFPILDYDSFEELYKKFKSIVSTAEAQSSQTTKGKAKIVDSRQEVKLPTREKIKKISDVIWNSLLRSSYKDRVHLQSVYSYLTGNKLDSFGVALVTLAACQLLNYDVHLALSEDHVWLVFGNTGETMEITWHGKIAEDKRGLSVAGGIEARTWLYLAGNPVICSRFMELAVIVLSINPHLNPTSVCAELADLQQQLLWILYEAGHLNNYPMSLMYLGEMEENHPMPGRIKCEDLYEQAIQSSITYYKNHHVYPYSCKGNYYYRKENFRDAFRCWTNASDVIRLYNYSRDDEEIYKEFLDIANEQIPQIMKTESSGHSAKSILRDPHCFANLLRFYDGICQWEEGSQTPILHIGWAKQLCFSISKFDYDIRSQIKIIIKSDFDDDNNNKKSSTSELIVCNEPKQSDVIKSQDSIKSSNGELKAEFPISLDELTAACGEKILNPDFLLHGGGVPFSESTVDDDDVDLNKHSDKKETVNNTETTSSLKMSSRETEKIMSPIQKDAASPQLPSPIINSDLKNETLKTEEDQSNDTNNNDGKMEIFDDDNTPKRPIITLKSRKMKGLKDLLLAEKLNTNAISLQITAQSHIGNKKSRSEESTGDGARPKRSRRE